MPDRGRMVVLVAVVAVIAAACSVASEPAPTAQPDTGASGEQLAVTVASFDLAVGDDQRLLVGLFTPDRRIVGGGEVEISVAGPSGGQPEPADTATGRFLPVPGSRTPADLSTPTILGEPAAHDHGPGREASPHGHEDPDAAGVYATQVDLDRPGVWEVTVTAAVDGTHRTGTAAFEVLADHEVPTAGDPAPVVHTPTLDDDLPPAAVDSRATIDGEIPDEVLHDTDLAHALAAGRPAVVVLSTPTYCSSRFCGPITDTVERLARRYGDRAAFVHVEIWADIDASRTNAAVEPWIGTPRGGNEPWVFLVGADGTVTARWDNVLDEAELVALLDRLPTR